MTVASDDETIGEAANRLNRALEHLEHTLNEKGYQVHASIPFSESARLTYGKLGDRWRLYVDFFERTDAERTMPLTQVGLAIRALAIGLLPELRSALDEKRSQVRVETIEAADLAEALLLEWRSS